MTHFEWGLVIAVAMIVVAFLAAHFAPLGYEDERGWHAGRNSGDDA